jgi:hypothetical protein
MFGALLVCAFLAGVWIDAHGFPSFAQSAYGTDSVGQDATDDESLRASIEQRCAFDTPRGWSMTGAASAKRLFRHDTLPVTADVACGWAAAEGVVAAHGALLAALEAGGATVLEDTGGERILIKDPEGNSSVELSAAVTVAKQRRAPDGLTIRKIVQRADHVGSDTYRLRFMQGDWPLDRGAEAEKAFDAFIASITADR